MDHIKDISSAGVKTDLFRRYVSQVSYLTYVTYVV